MSNQQSRIAPFANNAKDGHPSIGCSHYSNGLTLLGRLRPRARARRFGIVAHVTILQQVVDLAAPPHLVARVARDPIAETEQVAQRIKQCAAQKLGLSHHEATNQRAQSHTRCPAPE